MSAPPTDKQISYAIALLGKAGYNTRYMDASFSELGATMRERKDTVESWLRGQSRADVSALIDKLKKRVGEGQ